jgi:hypothetical protein
MGVWTKNYCKVCKKITTHHSKADVADALKSEQDYECWACKSRYINSMIRNNPFKQTENGNINNQVNSYDIDKIFDKLDQLSDRELINMLLFFAIANNCRSDRDTKEYIENINAVASFMQNRSKKSKK